MDPSLPVTSAQRPRGTRTGVVVRCRMKTDAGWTDATIHNVSDRGLMASTDAPPKAASYVDIRRGTLVIVGRVVWVRGRRFGVRTQDRIKASDLVNEPVVQQRPSVDRSSDDRRGPSRSEMDRRIARRSEASSRFASWFQIVAVTLVGCGLAAFLAVEAYRTLARPFARVAHALDESAH